MTNKSLNQDYIIIIGNINKLTSVCYLLNIKSSPLTIQVGRAARGKVSSVSADDNAV